MENNDLALGVIIYIYVYDKIMCGKGWKKDSRGEKERESLKPICILVSQILEWELWFVFRCVIFNYVK